MNWFCKRRRKVIAPVVLALWSFAIFVSVAHACGLDERLGQAGGNNTVNAMANHGSDDGAVPNCDQFCADDIPLLAKLKAVQDSPTAQAMLVPALVGEVFQLIAAPVASLLPSPDPPRGIALHIRFIRLAL